MQVYFEKLMSSRPVAVHFKTHEEAEMFFRAMKKEYPDRVIHWPNATYPKRYEQRGGVCYCPYLNEKFGSMTHAHRHLFEHDRGYEIVEFADLLYDSETEIDEADLPVEFLLA